MPAGIAEHLAQWAIAPSRRHYTRLTIRCGTRMAGRGQVILRLGKDQGPAVVFGLIVRAEDGDSRSGIHETDSRPLVFRYVPLCLRRHFGGWGFHSRPGGRWPTINASDSGRGSCRRRLRPKLGCSSPFELDSSMQVHAR